MASRESLKSNEIGVQPASKKTFPSPSNNDGDSNLSDDVIFRASNRLENEAENANFSSASLLLPLTRRSAPQVVECVKTSPLPTVAPFGPNILDKLITKNKLQSMKEAELRKDKTNQNETSESSSHGGNPKPTVDLQVLKKRKMIASRLRNHPFLQKKRKKLKKKLSSHIDAAKQGSSRAQKNCSSENANTSNTKKKSANPLETNKLEPQSSPNRLRRRLNSESSAPSQAKKNLANKNNRPMKSQLKVPNVEALKQNPKLRRSTRSDSPVLRNGKRRKCDGLTLDLYDVDRKRKKLVSDIASVKSDGMSDEQCSYVTASESDICSFLDLETNSQNLDTSDMKEESFDSTNFKLEIPTSPSNEGDDINSSSMNLAEPFKGIASNSSFPKVSPKKDSCSSDDECKSESFTGTDTFDSKETSDKLKVEHHLLGFSNFIKDKNEEPTLEEEEILLGETKLKEDDSDGGKSNLSVKEKLTSLVVKKDDSESDSEDEFTQPREGNKSPAAESTDDSISLANSTDLQNTCPLDADSSRTELSLSTSAESFLVHLQGRKVRSASLNDSCKLGKVSFTKCTTKEGFQKVGDEEQNKTSDTDDVSFTADNNQFELFVEQEYKRGRKKRSSSDTSLKRIRNRSVELSGAFSNSKTGFHLIPEDEKSRDATGPLLSSDIYCDEKENELYENDITEESNSEEASCSSSQVSEHPKLNENEFQDLEGKEKCSEGEETAAEQDCKANDHSEGQAQQMNGDAMAGSNDDADKSVTAVTTSETPEAQKMKESMLSALGLQSTSLPPSLQKINKSEDKYTGTLKAVIKLNKKNAGRMVFKQKDTSNAAASKNLEYRICSYAPGSENVPLTHLKDIAVNSLTKKSHSKPKAQFDLSGTLTEDDVDSQAKKEESAAAAEGTAPKEGEVKKALVIPEKSSSFSIHPERLCSDVCSYCHGKFGSLDTPCHIGQIKNSERRSKILSIEILLTKDSCLCDACFRYVDRRANCPSFKVQAPKSQKRQPLSGVVCSVQGCTQPANHSVRRKWIVKLKKSIAKKLMIDMDKIQHNQHLPFPLCSQHYYWVDYFTVCGICKKRLSRNNMYALGPEAEELNRFLQEDGIPVHLTDKLFLCKLCRYYSSLRLKYKDLSQLTPGHKTYFRSYRRKILQYHDIEVSESEEDVGGKSAEDESMDNNTGKVRRKKSKKSNSEDGKKSSNSEDKQRQTSFVDTSDCSYPADIMEVDQSGATTPTIDYSALGESSESVGFNNIASLLTNRNQSDPVGNPSRIQVKFGNLNVAKLNISHDSKSDHQVSKSHPPPTRPPFLPGEQDLPLKADISFQTRNKNSAWERCTSTIQFDKDTKQLWQELQRPYGNASSFLRHLVMLEKHWRSGSLVLVENADPRAAKYVSSVRNRVDSFERNFSSDKEFKAPNKVQSKALVDNSSPCASTAPRSDTPVPASFVSKTVSESVRSSCSDKQESLNEPSDKSDSFSDNLEVRSKEATQVPQMSLSSAVVNSSENNLNLNSNSNPYDIVNISLGNKTSAGAGASISASTSSLSVSVSNSLNSNSALIQSLNSQPISSLPIVNLLNLNSSNNNLSPSLSRSSSLSPSVSYASSLSSVACTSPSVSLILPPNMSTSLPSSLQNTFINLTSNTDGNSISLNQFNVSAPNSTSKPEISVSPSPNLRPNVSIAPKPSPIISSKPNPNIVPKANPNSGSKQNLNFSLKLNPNAPSKANSIIASKPNHNIISNMNPNITARPNPNLKQQNVMKVPGAKVLSVGNKLTFVSSPNSSSSSSSSSNINNNINSSNQFRKNLLSSISSVDAAQLNKGNVRKTNSNQGIPRQFPKFPPQLLRFPGPNAKSNVPPLELIVPKSFTMQTKPISSASTSGQAQSASLKSRSSAPLPTQGILDNLAYLRQFRSLKPKPPEPSRQSPTASTSSFTPMICDVRSLASSETDHSTLSSPSNSSMPKIPKALTITQVTQPSVFPRSVTVSLEKKPNQIPAAFLGGEKPSVSVFCEVNPPP